MHQEVDLEGVDHMLQGVDLEGADHMHREVDLEGVDHMLQVGVDHTLLEVEGEIVEKVHFLREVY